MYTTTITRTWATAGSPDHHYQTVTGQGMSRSPKRAFATADAAAGQPDDDHYALVLTMIEIRRDSQLICRRIGRITEFCFC
jgi:hypothetical protein